MNELPQEPYGIPPDLPANKGSVWAGLGLGCLGNLVLGALIGALSAVAPKAALFVFAGFGLIQLAYVIPLFMHFRNLKKSNTMAGIVVMASLTLIFTATCGALLISMDGKSFH